MSNAFLTQCALELAENKPKINEWLNEQEHPLELPLYLSVDIRVAPFKMAVVDTNLFPAGFNNICQLAINDIQSTLKNAIQNRVDSCQNILIIAESHTRNKWYLENIYVLQEMIKTAGFHCLLSTLDNKEPLILESEKGHRLSFSPLEHVLNEPKTPIDLIILNNDLSTGHPKILDQFDIPVYPPPIAGWHKRLKSSHFNIANAIISSFAYQMGMDPWQFSCLYSNVLDVDINQKDDQQRLADHAAMLFSQIKQKYKEHNINEKPFLFLKSNSGTYGMGVMPIEDPNDIINLNRKARNKLQKGKQSIPIHHFLLQEGVPSMSQINNGTSEVCIYKITNHFLGGFYRFHPNKSNRDNLNSKGMEFKKICNDTFNQCPQKEICGIQPDPCLPLYRTLARIAGLASAKEVIHYQSPNKVLAS